MDKAESIKKRTKELALEVFRLQKGIRYSPESFVIRKQLIRSITSVAANYRAACRARSTREFYSKICIATEEADESLFWLEFVVDSGICDTQMVNPIYNECEEIFKNSI